MVLLAFAEESVQILPDLSMFVHMAIIIAMIWILNRTFFRPINKIIAARSTGKGGQHAESNSMLASAEKKEQEFKDSLLSAREEGYKLIETERNAAILNKQETMAKARTEISVKRLADLEDLDKQTSVARASIAEEANKLADEISSNVLKVA